MRKRPLCFICIVVILIMWMLQVSREPASLETYDFQSVILYGKIYQCEYKEEKQILYLYQTVLSDKSQKIKLNNVRITCKKGQDIYQISDEISVKGDLKAMNSATNWGQFNVQSYYGAQKVLYTMWEPEITLLNRPDFSIPRWLKTVQENLGKQYDEILPNQYGALLKGISLGNKNDISEEIKELFQVGGISHILAISALHLQILGSNLYKLLRKCRFSVWLAVVFTGVCLSGYGILTGNSVATLRALLMFLISIGADVLGRTYDGSTAMALSAVILTAGNPEYLSYSGFWLSFGAVCSFVIFKENRQFYSGILLYFFMAPIMLIYFYELSTYSILLNLLVVPTVGVVLIFGLLGCMGSFLWMGLGKILLFPSVELLHIYKNLCVVCKKLPGHTWVMGKPEWVAVLGYYVIMTLALYLFRKNRLKKRRVLCLLMIIPAFMLLIPIRTKGIQITMLDIGQGDGVVIQTEVGHTYLIDGGSTSEKDIGKYRILPFLKYEGVRNIEVVFLTHADEDHMNGILELLDMIRVGDVELEIERIVLPDWTDMAPFEQIYKKANENNIEIYRFEKDGVMMDGEMQLICLGPDREDYTKKTNEGSLVLRLEYGDFSMLFTGDLEGNKEDALLGTYGDVDILKVAHHGSKQSTSEKFLQEVKPEISLISFGKDNSYGHPHQELLDRLAACNSKVFDTVSCGAIMIRTDGEKIDLKTYKQYNEP